MHSLLNYASSDDEDDDDDKAVTSSSLTAAGGPPSINPPPAVFSASAPLISSVPLGLPPPAKSAATKRSRASVLSSLASSLSSLHSTNSPFSTSILDSTLDNDTPRPTTEPAPAPPITAPSLAHSGGSAVGSVVVNGSKKSSLPSAASLLSALPSDRAGWEQRTGSNASAAPLAKSQYHTVPLPASLRPPASESDAFRFTPHSHNAAAHEAIHKQQKQQQQPIAPSSSPDSIIPARSTATTIASTLANDAAPAPSTSKPLPSRPTGVLFAPPQVSRKRANISTEDIGSHNVYTHSLHD